MKTLLCLLPLLLTAPASAQNDKAAGAPKEFHLYDTDDILDHVIARSDNGNYDDEDYQLWRHYLSQTQPAVRTLKTYFRNASIEFCVPVELLEAIGQVENNWTQVGPSIDRGWGIMHLVENDYSHTLREAAELLGKTPQVLKDSARQNIRGAAALLAIYAGVKVSGDKGCKNVPPSPEAWFPAVKRFTGLINDELREMQAERYYEVVRQGVTSRTLSNEIVTLPPHPDIDITSQLVHKRRPGASPDYAPAIWNPSTQSPNHYGRGEYVIDTWVNHWVGVGTYAGAISWFQHPQNRDSSTHFVIRNFDGEISQCVEISQASWNCGAKGYPANNRRSISVEHEATVSNPDLWYSAPMLNTSATVARYFADLYNIPKVRELPGMMGHGEMPGVSKNCPGPMPWDTWMGLLNGTTTYTGR